MVSIKLQRVARVKLGRLAATRLRRVSPRCTALRPARGHSYPLFQERAASRIQKTVRRCLYMAALARTVGLGA